MWCSLWFLWWEQIPDHMDSTCLRVPLYELRFRSVTMMNPLGPINVCSNDPIPPPITAAIDPLTSHLPLTGLIKLRWSIWVHVILYALSLCHLPFKLRSAVMNFAVLNCVNEIWRHRNVFFYTLSLLGTFCSLIQLCVRFCSVCLSVCFYRPN